MIGVKRIKMKKAYHISILMEIILEREESDPPFPKELPLAMKKSIISNLNISDETNDMFMDSMQEYTELPIESFHFSLE